MERPDNDNWLDEALDQAIASHDTQPDFDSWKANHPEAVQKLTSPATPRAGRPVIRRITMNGLFVKLAVAAAIVVAAVIGITQLTKSEDVAVTGIREVTTLSGPLTHTLADGSVVKLAEGAVIGIDATRQRGLEHLAGAIDVTVAKGKGEFIVTTPYGDVKALGTQFKLDLVDGIAENTNEKVQLLSVEVTEGKVEVSNARGSSLLGANQRLVVASDAGPYDFTQDTSLPAGLQKRIGAMVAAFEAGDASAWAANFNMNYAYRLVKGQEPYDPQRFGGSEEDLQRLRQAFADVESPEQLAQMFLSAVNITTPTEVYVRSVRVDETGDHAIAECVQRHSPRHMTITNPKWHYFDNDWWQIDD
ncbi:MAG: FecR domain-containing protein [Sedimentisphaerales bacterium]|nr:FecR domain-containing protein [Sedimentisphaerales bacterium]